MHQLYHNLVVQIVLLVVMFQPGFTQQNNPDYYYINATNGSNLYTFSSLTPTISQFLYYPSDFNQAIPAGPIHKIYVRSLSVKTDAEYTDFLIKIKHTNATAIPAGPWDNFEITDTVLYSSRYIFANVWANEWLEIPLQKPFDYDGVSNIAIEISGSNYRNGFSTSFHNPALPNLPVRMKYGSPSGTNYTNNFPPIFLGIDVCTINNQFLGNDTLICEGSTLELNAGNLGNIFSWNDHSNQAKLTINTAGLYYVTVRDGICENTDSIQISISPLAKAERILVTHLNDKTFQFEVINPENIQDYFWDFGDGNTKIGPNVTHTYASLQNFEVSCTLRNACGSVTLASSMNQLLSINQQNANSMGLRIFPIPTQGNIYITVNAAKNKYQVQIFDVSGRLLLEELNIKSLDLSKFTKGTYYLKVTSLTQAITSTQKIIKH